MAKRKTGEQPEIVQQLRPDDSGWLAELRRARTEPIDLAPGPDDDDSDQPPLPSEPPKAEPAEPPQSERIEPAPETDPAPPQGADPTPPQEVDPAPPPGEGGTPPPPGEGGTPPPAWTHPTPPLPRSRPLPPPPRARPLVAERHHVDVTPAPALRPARRPRGPGDKDRVRRSLLRRWDLVIPTLALVLGATIGLTWRGANNPGPGEPVANPGSTVASGPSASPTELPQSIVVTNIRYDGDSITLSWIDPTAGQALFVISQILSDEEDARFVRSLPTGQTEAVITGLDPNASQYCYRVFAVLNGGAVARSATTCAQKRNPA